jgi:Mrp family chromosome partitioning ATPase
MGRLHVLPTGQLPSNPGEFVGTQALMRVLEELRRGHDYVLVDSPPMLAVGDPITLSTRVDAIVPVVRLGVANRPMLRDLARNLRVSPAPKLGFVFTGAEAHEMYGYTYGYYGSDQAEESSSGLREVSSIGR